MKKYFKIILLVVFILAISIGVSAIRVKNTKIESQKEPSSQLISTTLKINDGTNTRSFDISKFVGQNALAVTQTEVKTISTGTGTNAFVTSINSHIADSKKHEFWELDANGTETRVGAGSYIIQKGDSIEWNLNTY